MNVANMGNISAESFGSWPQQGKHELLPQILAVFFVADPVLQVVGRSHYTYQATSVIQAEVWPQTCLISNHICPAR